MTKVADRLKELARLKAEEKRLKVEWQQAQRRRKTYEFDLHSFMEDEDLKTVRTDTHTFTAKSTTYGVVQDERAFLAWAQENDLEEDFFTLQEVGQRLNELVRQRLADGEELPPGVGWRVNDYISTTEN